MLWGVEDHVTDRFVQAGVPKGKHIFSLKTVLRLMHLIRQKHS
jgi:hypothetical protein